MFICPGDAVRKRWKTVLDIQVTAIDRETMAVCEQWAWIIPTIHRSRNGAEIYKTTPIACKETTAEISNRRIICILEQ